MIYVPFGALDEVGIQMRVQSNQIISTYVCVCMCVYVCVYIYIYIYVCIYTRNNSERSIRTQILTFWHRRFTFNSNKSPT